MLGVDENDELIDPLKKGSSDLEANNPSRK
jgi:hypothetical protein